MEKMDVLVASAPQLCPSDAVPHPAWFALWKLSWAMMVPGAGVGVAVAGNAVGVGVAADGVVGVAVGEVDWTTSASLLVNSSSNQMRFWLSAERPSWGWLKAV